MTGNAELHNQADASTEQQDQGSSCYSKEVHTSVKHFELSEFAKRTESTVLVESDQKFKSARQRMKARESIKCPEV
jgi:hypothetical protein